MLENIEKAIISLKIWLMRISKQMRELILP